MHTPKAAKSQIEEYMRRLGVSKLNAMQQQLKNDFPNEKNIKLLSPTGSGKTIAYLFPLVCDIDTSNDKPQAIIVSPSRELAKQIGDVETSMKSAVRCVSCYGGHTAMAEHKTIEGKKPHIVVGTPGRLIDHLTKENFDGSGIKTIVFDEFDKCLEFGFKDEIMQLLQLLPSLDRYLFISATDTERTTAFFSDGGTTYLPDNGSFKVYDYRSGETVTKRISIHIVNSPEKDKLDSLRSLLLANGTANSIVFLNYRTAVERTYQYLKSQGFYCEMFHGGMEQEHREKSLYKFINGTSNILVSTDLASRGLDMPDVDNVIHYHLPQTEESYIHRNGRTARWEAEGNSFFIIGPEESVPEYIKDYDTIEIVPDNSKPEAPEWTSIYIGKGKKDKISKVDILGFICKQGGVSGGDVGRIDVRDNFSFVAVRRQVARQILLSVRGLKIKGVKTIIQEAR